MGLQEDVQALVAATDALHQTVLAKEAQWETRLAQAEQQVSAFIQSGAASRPVTPNLLPDSKKFENLCQGQLNTIMAWDEGGLAHPWNGFFLNGATGSLRVEVVYVGDQTRLMELGLWPLGPLDDMVAPAPHETLTDYGQDSNIVVFDLTLDTWTNTGASTAYVPFIFQTDCLEYTGWSKGRFKTQQSSYISVLAAEHLSFELFRDRAGDMGPIGAAEAGQGWRHYSGSREGFGGCNTSYVLTDLDEITPALGARLKFALALPYQGFGDHQGLPIWCGYSGRYDIGDVPQF